MKTRILATSAAVALAASAFPASAQERDRPAADGATVRVLGTVIDHSTRQPVPRADIVLRRPRGA